MAKKYHGGKEMSMSGGFAGLPSEVKMKEYPKAQYSGPEDYNDSRGGIDALAKSNHSNMMKDRGKRS